MQFSNNIAEVGRMFRPEPAAEGPEEPLRDWTFNLTTLPELCCVSSILWDVFQLNHVLLLDRYSKTYM